MAPRANLAPVRRTGAIWGLSAIIAALAAAGWLVWPRPDPLHTAFALPWIALTVACVVASLAVVNFEFGGQGWAVNFVEVPMVVGLVFAGPEHVLEARLVAAAIVFIGYRRQPAHKAALNFAAVALETVVAVRLYFAVLGGASPVSHQGWLAAFVAAGVAHIVSHAAVLSAIWLTSRSVSRQAVRTALATVVIVTVTNCCLSLVTVSVLWIDWVGGILLVALCLLLGFGYQAHQRLRRRQSVLERIHDFTQAVDGHTDVDGVISATLKAARETMAAGSSELVIRQGSTWLHYRCDDWGVQARTVPRPDTLERLALAGGCGLVVPRSGGGDTIGRYELASRGLADAVSVPLQTPDLEGVLTVADRQSAIVSFEGEDLRALTSMGAHAAVALRSALLLERLHAEVSDKEYQALHDALTGLPNRVLFAARINELITGDARPTRGARVAVILADLDDFREVNDTLGHQVGDVVLQATAVGLLAEIAPAGTVAHLGGDEFGVVVRADSVRAALDAALAVQGAIQRPIEVEGLPIEVRASVGVALFPDHGDDVATLLRLADVALYAAKETRAGPTLYEARNDHYSPRRLTLAAELRQAIEGGELGVSYQPQLDLRTGAVTSVEALVRWSHHRHGPVPPDEFVPVAEQTGLIGLLTDYVLTEALEQQASWARRGLSLEVAVNLSPRVLQQGHLPSLVARRLSDAGVDPACLTLELTETGLITDPGRVTTVLHQLAAMGVRTSIDDFGTGWSSLSRLSTLPVGEVKIDKSFVFAMADGEDETVVRSIVDLGHNLDLRVVAEGVEDPATLERLRVLRCDAVQGYVLSRALPAAPFESWLAGRKVGAEPSRVIVPMRKARGEPS